jgi:hypothetical protein
MKSLKKIEQVKKHIRSLGKVETTSRLLGALGISGIAGLPLNRGGGVHRRNTDA